MRKAAAKGHASAGMARLAGADEKATKEKAAKEKAKEQARAVRRAADAGRKTL